MNMGNGKEYYAFISYKREDEQWAKWLQHKLEHYKLPVNLNGRSDLPKEIRPVFRDTSELNPGNLPQQIQNALEQSRYLIVVCSPRSAKSEWVNREVETFIGMGKVDKIIPFIIEGKAFAKNPEEECFPEAIRNLPSEQEILGANISEMGRDAAAVKVVAQMFGLRFDELWQRYEREQRKKRNVKILSISALVISALVVTGWIWNQRTKIKMENWAKMENEAKLISRKANELTSQGKSDIAQRALMEVLPKNLKRPDRPYTTEAEKALRYAITNNTEVLGDVEDAVYSPDGKDILMVYNDTLRIWDVEKGGKPRFLSRVEGVGTATYSPDGKRVAVGSGMIQILDAASGKEILSMPAEGMVNSIAFSPDGRRMVTGSWTSYSYEEMNGFMQIWDAESGKELYRWKDYIDPDGRDAVQFSPDGKRILLVSAGNGIRVFESEKGEKVSELKKKNVTSAFFWSDSKKVITSSRGKLIVWNTDNGKEDVFANYGEHARPSVTGDSNGKIAINLGEIMIINTCTGENFRVLGSEHSHSDEDWNDDGIDVVRLSPDGHHLLSISEDGYEGRYGKLKIWTMSNAVCELVGHTAQVNSINFSADGSRIVSASMYDNTVRVWDVQSQKELLSFSPPSYAQFAMFTSDGRGIITVNYYHDLEIWDAQEGKEIAKVKGMQWDYRCAYDPIHGTIIYCTEKGIGLFDDKTGESAGSIEGNYTTVDYNAATKRIVTSSYEALGFDSSYYNFVETGEISVWDAETKEKTHSFDAVVHMGDVLFSPDGKYILCYSNYEDGGSGPICIMDARTGKVIHELEGHQGTIESVSFSSDNKWIVSSSAIDGSVKVWDAEYGGEIAEFEALEGIFSPDGRKLALITPYNTIRIVDFPPLQDLIDKTRECFKDKPLTSWERKAYHLE